jgi:preprotein translocase subunit SecD
MNCVLEGSLVQLKRILAAVLVLAGCQGRPDSAPRPRASESFFETRLMHQDPGFGRVEAEWEGETVYLDSRSVISDADIQSLRPEIVSPADLRLWVILRPEVVDRVGSEMNRAIGIRMAVVVDGRLLHAPVIRDALPARIMIGGLGLSQEEAERLAALARARWPERNR